MKYENEGNAKLGGLVKDLGFLFDCYEADGTIYGREITFFLRNSLEIPKNVVTLQPEISPLQLKGYVDVAHSCRLYGAVSFL